MICVSSFKFCASNLNLCQKVQLNSLFWINIYFFDLRENPMIKMGTVINDLIKNDVEYLKNKLHEDGMEIKAKLNELITNFEDYIKTGVSSNLEKNFKNGQNKQTNRIQKECFEENGLPQRKLADITNSNQIEGIKIKCEKLSGMVFPGPESTTLSKEVNDATGCANNDDIPAPKCIPKRTTRTRKKPIRYTNTDEKTKNTSDVIIENTNAQTNDFCYTSLRETVEKSSSNNQNETMTLVQLRKESLEEKIEPSRSKRTRTIRKIKVKEEEITAGNSNGTANNFQADLQNSGQTVYEDALSSLGAQSPLGSAQYTTIVTNTKSEDINENAMSVKHSKHNTINSTIVVEKPIIVIGSKSKTLLHDLDTPKRKTEEAKKKEQPFKQLPSKESLTKLVRTREIRKMNEDSGCALKYKNNTPLSKIPAKINSTNKINKFVQRQDSNSNKNMSPSAQSQSALKPPQVEYSEKERRRQEKEALKKREVLRLTEEKKRIREEKQMKARQKRELLEKEKQDFLESQKLKEEKHRQVLAEKAEKLQKQREEFERKQRLAKKRVEELKEKENRQIPIYMITPAPLLPTEECYDSDDEQRTRGTFSKQKLSWTGKSNLKKMQLVISAVGEACKNSFFSRQIHTPNLQEIFETISPRKLKRTSSAIWRTPPRYTVLMEHTSINFSEDENES